MRFLVILFVLFAPCSTIAQEQQEKKIIQTSIFFGGGSWFIDDEQANDLRRLVDSIPDIDNYQISLYSHTDNIGGRRFNEWLSQMRSQSVLQELVEKNIPADYIQIKDFGQENPWFSNEDWEGRVLNRRVDVVFSPIIF